MSKLDDLVTELVAKSGPRVEPGTRAAHVNLNWGSEQFGTVREDGDMREQWARHVRSLCGQIFMQGMSAGWDKHVAVVAQRDREAGPEGGNPDAHFTQGAVDRAVAFAEAHQYAKDTTAELNERLAEAREVREERVTRYKAGLCICDDGNGNTGCPVHDPETGRLA